MIPRPPRSTLLPYTTLFRSRRRRASTTASSVLREQDPDVLLVFGEPGARDAREIGRGHGADLREELVLLRVATDHLEAREQRGDRKSTRLNSSHDQISYAVF